jgi:ribosomal protein L40E
MDTSLDPLRSDALCPSCGAPVPSEASSCVVCGRQIAPAPAPAAALLAAASPDTTAAAEPAETAERIALTEPPANITPIGAAAAEPAEPARPAATPANTRICEWCGAANPIDAQRCERCGASFPRPEQDALLTRASAERVRLAMNEIEMHERLRTPWWKRLFGGKAS